MGTKLLYYPNLVMNMFIIILTLNLQQASSIDTFSAGQVAVETALISISTEGTNNPLLLTIPDQLFACKHISVGKQVI